MKKLKVATSIIRNLWMLISLIISNFWFLLTIVIISIVILVITLFIGSIAALLPVEGPTSSIAYYNAKNAYGMPFQVNKLKLGESILDSKIDNFTNPMTSDYLLKINDNNCDLNMYNSFNLNGIDDGTKAILLINKKINNELQKEYPNYIIHFNINKVYYDIAQNKIFTIYNSNTGIKNAKYIQFTLEECQNGQVKKRAGKYFYDILKKDRTNNFVSLKNDGLDFLFLKNKELGFNENIKDILETGFSINNNIKIKDLLLDSGFDGNIISKISNIETELSSIMNDKIKIEGLLANIVPDNNEGLLEIIDGINGIISSNTYLTQFFNNFTLKVNNMTEFQSKFFNIGTSYKNGYNCYIDNNGITKKNFLLSNYIQNNIDDKENYKIFSEDQDYSNLLENCNQKDIDLGRYNCTNLGERNIDKLNHQNYIYNNSNETINSVNTIINCNENDIINDQQNHSNLTLYINKLQSDLNLLRNEKNKYTTNIISGTNTIVDNEIFYDALIKIIIAVDNENNFKLKQSFLIDLFNFVGIKELKLGGTTSNQEILNEFKIGLSYFNLKNLNKNDNEMFISMDDFNGFGVEEAKELLTFDEEEDKDMYSFSYEINKNGQDQGSGYNPTNQLSSPIYKLGNYYKNDDRKTNGWICTDDFVVNLTKEDLYTGKRIEKDCWIPCGESTCLHTDREDIKPLVSNVSVTYYKKLKFTDDENNPGKNKRSKNKLNYFYEATQVNDLSKFWWEGNENDNISYIQNIHLDNKTILFKGIYVTVSSFGIKVDENGEIDILRDRDGEILLEDAPIKFEIGFLTGLDDKYCNDYATINSSCNINKYKTKALSEANSCKNINGETTCGRENGNNLIIERSNYNDMFESDINSLKDVDNKNFKIDYFNNKIEEYISYILENKTINNNINYILNDRYLSKKETYAKPEEMDNLLGEQNNALYNKPLTFNNYSFSTKGLLEKYMIFSSNYNNYKDLDSNYKDPFNNNEETSNDGKPIFDICYDFKNINNIYRETEGLGDYKYDIQKYGNTRKLPGFYNSSLMDCYSTYFPYVEYNNNGDLNNTASILIKDEEKNELLFLYNKIKNKTYYKNIENAMMELIKNGEKPLYEYINNNEYKQYSYQRFISLFLLSRFNRDYINAIYEGFLKDEYNLNSSEITTNKKELYIDFLGYIQEPIREGTNKTYQDFIKGEMLKQRIGLEPFRYYTNYFSGETLGNNNNNLTRTLPLSSFEIANKKFRKSNITNEFNRFFDLSKSFDFSNSIYSRQEKVHKIKVNPNIYLISFINSIKENGDYLLDFYNDKDFYRYNKIEANKIDIDKNSLFTILDYYKRSILAESTRTMKSYHNDLNNLKLSEAMNDLTIEVTDMFTEQYKDMLGTYILTQHLVDGNISNEKFSNKTLSIKNTYLNHINNEEAKILRSTYAGYKKEMLSSFLGNISTIGILNKESTYYDEKKKIIQILFTINNTKLISNDGRLSLSFNNDKTIFTKNYVYNCDNHIGDSKDRCLAFGGVKPNNINNPKGIYDFAINFNINMKNYNFFYIDSIRKGEIFLLPVYKKFNSSTLEYYKNIDLINNKQLIDYINDWSNFSFGENQYQVLKNNTKLYRLLYGYIDINIPTYERDIDLFSESSKNILKDILSEEEYEALLNIENINNEKIFNYIKEIFFPDFQIDYNSYYNHINYTSYNIKYYLINRMSIGRYNIPFIQKSNKENIQNKFRFLTGKRDNLDNLNADKIIPLIKIKNMFYYNNENNLESGFSYKNKEYQQYSFLNSKNNNEENLEDIIEQYDDIEYPYIPIFNTVIMDVIDNNRKMYLGVLEMLDKTKDFTSPNNITNEDIIDYRSINTLNPFYFLYLDNNITRDFSFNLQEISGDSISGFSNFSLDGIGNVTNEYDTIKGKKIKTLINRKLDEHIAEYSTQLNTTTDVNKKDLLTKKITALNFYKGYSFAKYQSELDYLISYAVEKDYRSGGQMNKDIKYDRNMRGMPSSNLISFSGTGASLPAEQKEQVKTLLTTHFSKTYGYTGNCTWFVNLFYQFPKKGGAGKDYGTAFDSTKYSRSTITYGMTADKKIKQLRAGDVISFPDDGRGCKSDTMYGHVAVILDVNYDKKTYTMAEMNIKHAYNTRVRTRSIDTICRADMVRGFPIKHLK